MGCRFVKKIGGMMFLVAACSELKAPKALPKIQSNKLLVATTTNFQTGMLSIFDPIHLHFNLRFSAVHSDSVPKHIEGFSDVFVLNRLGGDNIQRVERLTGKILSQKSFGRGSNPQDIKKIAGNVFVSLLNEPKLMIWDLERGEKKDEIDLSKFSDLDGIPEATQMQAVGTQLWLQLQRLDRLKKYTPTGESQIAVIDPQNKLIIDRIVMKGSNPVTPFKVGYDQTLFVANAGFVGMNSQLDGGIERIDPGQSKSLGFVVSEEELGGDLVDFECASVEACVAIVSCPETELVQFDPRSGKRIRTLWKSSGYHLLQILREGDSRLLYVSDSNPQDPSIRVWSEETLSQLENKRWSLELPPFQMEWF